MTTFGIIDVANLFHRIRHVVQGDAYTKAGMTLTIIFRSLRKMRRDLKVDHFVFCCEGESWRYTVYPQYKAKRKLDRMLAKPAEKEENEAFFVVMDDFQKFVAEKTRCTVLQQNGVEGDDFVARWVQLHPNDKHIILSGDSDFLQLMDHNVQIYNGVDRRLISIDGVIDDDGQPMAFEVDGSSGKLKVKGTIKELKKAHEKDERERERKHLANEKLRKAAFDEQEKIRAATEDGYKAKIYVPTPFDWKDYSFEPEAEWWKKALFVKLIRGDTGDGIFSAAPGVRYKGSAKKVGILEAWADRNVRGMHWNNFMLTEWDKIVGEDEMGNAITKRVTVREQFEFNRVLIDLTAQPEEVKNLMDEVILKAIQKPPVAAVGIGFMQFCGRNNLPALSKEAHDHAAYLNAGYQ